MKAPYKATGPRRINFYFIWFIGIGYEQDIIRSHNHALTVQSLFLPFCKIQACQDFEKYG